MICQLIPFHHFNHPTLICSLYLYLSSLRGGPMIYRTAELFRYELLMILHHQQQVKEVSRFLYAHLKSCWTEQLQEC